MPNNNLRLYNVDFTGTHPANKVVNERHTLNRQKNLPVAPLSGAFYSNTMVVTNTDTGAVLEKNVDYRFLEHFFTLREVTGKPVTGVLLIRDSNTNSKITLSYQCVGGSFATSSQSLVELLGQFDDSNPDYSWYNILLAEASDILDDTPPIGGKLTFESMCFVLEKIRNSILWSDTEQYQNTVNYVNRLMEDVELQTRDMLDGFLTATFNEFILKVNKSFLKLDVLPNIPLATIEDGAQAMDDETRITDFETNKYVALDAIVSFKKAAHNYFVNMSKTNIGKNRGTALIPTKEALFDMKNGGVGILLSRTEYTATNTEFELDVYPPDSGADNVYTIFKISNNENNRGGIFIASDRNNGNMHFGIHTSGLISVDMTWRKIIFDNDSNTITDLVSQHLLDIENPHNTNKASVKLNLVENLEPINLEEVLCLDNCRKYVTFDAFLLFFKTYMVSTGAAAEDPRNEYTGIDKTTIIYSKSRPSVMDGCEAEPVVITLPAPLEAFTTDKQVVSVSNIQSGRELNITLAHVKGKIPLAAVEIISGALPSGLSIVIDVLNPIFNVYKILLIGTSAVSGIFSTTIRISSTTGERILLPIELNITEVDNLNLEFTSTQTVIEQSTIETLTILLTGAPINSTVKVIAYSKYIGALTDSAPSIIIEKEFLLKTNSTGNSSISFQGGNVAGTIALGEWENWAKTTNLAVNVETPKFIRTFV